MRKYLLASTAFHALLAGLLWVGLPEFGQQLPEDGGLTVDIVTDMPNEPPAPQPAAQAPVPERKAASRQAQATPEKLKETPKSPPPPPPPPPLAPPEPPPPSPPPPAPPPPPPPPAPTPAPKPEPLPVPEPKPAPPSPPPPPPPPLPVAPQAKPTPPKPKPEPAKVAKKEPPKPAEPEDDFSALLKSVENLDTRVRADQARDGKGQVASNQPARAAQKGASTARLGAAGLSRLVADQIQPCWNIPAGAQGLPGMVVPINIRMGPDGTVQSVKPVEEARMRTDPVYRAVAESALRATLQCSPLKLPGYEYDMWKDIIMNFRPDQMG